MKLHELKQKNAMDDTALVGLAHRAGLVLSAEDEAMLTQTGAQSGVAGSRNPAHNAARERLLLKLDTYEALRRSRISQWLSQISVMLSIIAALMSIYADIKK